MTSPRIAILPFSELIHVKPYPHHKDDLAQELNNYCAYKVEAHEAFHEQLGKGIGRNLLEEGKVEELSKRLFVVEGLLNLLSPYEKMALSDALKNEQAAMSYFSALFDVCERDKVDKEAYQALITVVNNLPAEEGKARVSTWPVLTQFPYYRAPGLPYALETGGNKGMCRPDGIQFTVQPGSKLGHIFSVAKAR